MFIVIPAYCPDEKIFGVIEGLSGEDRRFVVVDDGSGMDYASVFRRIEKEYGDRAVVLHHSINRGKGRALKTAFEYVSHICCDDDGILTVDADGQHLAPDAENVIKAWGNDKECLVIGSRHFNGKVPFHNKAGNAISRSIFAITTGVRIWDTQTGLRAFSAKLIPDLLEVKGERYEYEMAQLLYATKHHVGILEVTINTVYIAGNKSSHFRIFRDTFLINKMIFVFMLASFSCFVVDYSLLLGLVSVFNHLPSTKELWPGEYRMPLFGMMVDTHLVALIIARGTSSFLNFMLNRKIVFKTGSMARIFRFYIVIIGLMLANYGLLTLVATSNTFPLWIAQLVIQASLYPFSFILQRKFVFPDKNRRKTKTV